MLPFGVNSIEDVEYSSKLTIGLNKLLDSASLTDVDLHVDDGLLRPLKAVLAARSPIFQAMFEQDFCEKKESFVKMSGFNVNVGTRDAQIHLLITCSQC